MYGLASRLRADGRHGRGPCHASALRRARLHGRPRRRRRFRRASAPSPASTACARRLRRNAAPLVRSSAWRSPWRSGTSSPRASPTTRRLGRSSSAASVSGRSCGWTAADVATAFVPSGAEGILGAARHAGGCGAPGALGGRRRLAADGRLRLGRRGPVRPVPVRSRLRRADGTFPAPGRRRSRTRSAMSPSRGTATSTSTDSRGAGRLPRSRRVRFDRAVRDFPAPPLRTRARAGRRGAHPVRGGLFAGHPPDRSRHPCGPPVGDGGRRAGARHRRTLSGERKPRRHPERRRSRTAWSGCASMRAATAWSAARCSSAPARTTPSRRSAWWWAATCTTSRTVSGSDSAMTAPSILPTRSGRRWSLRLRL